MDSASYLLGSGNFRHALHVRWMFVGARCGASALHEHYRGAWRPTRGTKHLVSIKYRMFRVQLLFDRLERSHINCLWLAYTEGR